MLLDGTVGYWSADWLWGLPLIAVSVVVHAVGLGIIALCLRWLFDPSLDQPRDARSIFFRFPIITGLTTLLLTALHGIGALLWALAYVRLGAVPDFATAVYHSLFMMTTIGSGISVEPHWKLLGDCRPSAAGYSSA